jgi:hypothetical protein
MTMKATHYFRTRTPIKHPEAIQYRSYVEQALTDYIALEEQTDGRTRRWIYIPEEDKYMRVVVEPDGETVHNAFFDRDFLRR